MMRAMDSCWQPGGQEKRWLAFGTLSWQSKKTEELQTGAAQPCRSWKILQLGKIAALSCCRGARESLLLAHLQVRVRHAELFVDIRQRRNPACHAHPKGGAGFEGFLLG